MLKHKSVSKDTKYSRQIYQQGIINAVFKNWGSVVLFRKRFGSFFKFLRE